jgi:hypothetical protein
VSVNIVAAQRDIRLHFPECPTANQANLDVVREYAISHLAVPLVRVLAALRMSEQSRGGDLDKRAVREKMKKTRK